MNNARNWTSGRQIKHHITFKTTKTTQKKRMPIAWLLNSKINDAVLWS